MIKINKQLFQKFEPLRFLLENIQDGNIQLGENTSLPLENRSVSFSEKLKSRRCDLESFVSCKILIRKDRHRSFFEALYYMCFVLKYHEQSLDKLVPYNGMFFEEGIYRGFVSFDRGFSDKKTKNFWILRKVMLKDNPPLKSFKAFYINP